MLLRRLHDDDPFFSLEEYGVGRGAYALSKKSSFLLSFLVSFFAILAHASFLYGQFAVDWRLDINFGANVTVNTTALADDPLLQFALNYLGVDPDSVFRVFALEESGATKTVNTFTYMQALNELFDENTFRTVTTGVLIMVFSGVWPHVKLLALHILWYIRQGKSPRSRALYWLDAFGKWSLADVFLVCTMLAVLQLRASLDAHSAFDIAKEALNNESKVEALMELEVYSPELCKQIVEGGFSANMSTCAATFHKIDTARQTVIDLGISVEDLTSTLNQYLEETVVDGDASFTLNVVGELGISAFCVGALTSLLLSFFVNLVDERLRRLEANHPASLGASASIIGYEVDAVHRPASALFLAHRAAPRTVTAENSRLCCRRHFSSEIVLLLLCLATALIVVVGCFTPVAERHVIGSFPEILEGLGADGLKQRFSIFTTTQRSGAAGGADVFMMTTLGLFALGAPIARAAATTVLFIYPMRAGPQSRVLGVLESLGSFCGQEVLLLALLLVYLEMTPITLTIIRHLHLKWLCTILYALPFGLSEECLAVEMVFLWPVLLVVLGWVLSVFVAFVVVGFGYRALNPIGDGSDGLPTLCFSFCPKPRGCFQMFLPAEEVQFAGLVEEDDQRRASTLQNFPSSGGLSSASLTLSKSIN